MVYAYVYPSEREACLYFRTFILNNDITRSRVAGVYTAQLDNGDEYCFMNERCYQKWNLGRTYMRDSKLYHSGFLCTERSEE